MNLFDKCCAVLAFMLGAVFMLLGAFGLIFGSNAHFTLPPILGGLPLLFGWGMVRPIYVAWKATPPDESPSPFISGGRAVALDEQLRVNQDLPCGECGYNLRTMHVESSCPECGLAVARSIIRYERPGGH